MQFFHFNLLSFEAIVKNKKPGRFLIDRAFCSTSFLLLVCFTQSCYVFIICCFTKQHSTAYRHNGIIPANRYTLFCYLLFTILLMHFYFLVYNFIYHASHRFIFYLSLGNRKLKSPADSGGAQVIENQFLLIHLRNMPRYCYNPPSVN